MARAMWSGYLGFGLVNIPVGLHSATSDGTVHFNQLHKGTSNRIRYKKVDEVTGEEVPATDIVSGFDTGDGSYVVVTKDELKGVAAGRSEMIEITDFVDLDQIDPVYFRQSYYLAPRGKGADRAYSLLRQTLQESGKVGVATLILRDKEHLVAVRPAEGVLVLETMYFADEVRNPAEELDSLPEAETFVGRELDVAKLLVDSLSTDWEPGRYQNTYRLRLEQLIDEKRDGREVVFQAEEPKSNVIDLMAALEASLAKGGGRPRSGGTKDNGKEDVAEEDDGPEVAAAQA
jgi:DNA end-binding protein Ku